MSGERCKNLSFPKRVFLQVATVALGGGILFGYDLGIISGALPQLKSYFSLNCFQKEMVVSSQMFGSLVGSVVGSYIMDVVGRRSCIVWSVVVFIISAIMLSLSPIYGFLILGRLLVGFGIALSAASECIYVSEVAPVNIRGSLVSLNEVGITVGFLLSFGVNSVFSTLTNNGWRYMFALPAIFSLSILHVIRKLPKSPRYLIMKNRFAEARCALHTLRSLNNDLEKSAVEQELMAMSFVDENAAAEEGKHCDISVLNHPALFIGCGLVFFQQATGQPNLILYASTLFATLGFGSDLSNNLAALGLGVVKVFSTMICLFLVDKYRRKTFLKTGLVIMSASLFILAYLSSSYSFPANFCVDKAADVMSNNSRTVISSTLMTNSTRNDLITTLTPVISNNLRTTVNPITDINSTSFITDPMMPNHLNSTSDNSISVVGNHGTRILILFFLMIFVSSYSISFGPLTWIVSSEIFPTKYRGKFFSIATGFNWSLNLVISLSFLHFLKAFDGLTVPLILYGAVAVSAIVFVFKWVPETKGRTLEEIDSLLSSQVLKFPQCCCFSCKQQEDSLALPLIS